ncbi:hypothetical protein NBRC110019_09710 [Neptunitalea chrysea]|uniref:Uncharacterized protein n=1 Tax=Neptunitalea chrysea TaxID=1647581 RepID=A0A9W6B4X7_9FLAO|nr:hypothetical protein NBRC110019_09710 [Neptunitalea chrysea]
MGFISHAENLCINDTVLSVNKVTDAYIEFSSDSFNLQRFVKTSDLSSGLEKYIELTESEEQEEEVAECHGINFHNCYVQPFYAYLFDYYGITSLKKKSYFSKYSEIVPSTKWYVVFGVFRI